MRLWHVIKQTVGIIYCITNSVTSVTFFHDSLTKVYTGLQRPLITSALVDASKPECLLEICQKSMFIVLHLYHVLVSLTDDVCSDALLNV